MIEKLLPCPKCNSPAKLKQISDWSCRIECSNEDCCIETYQDDKNTLIENWNARPKVIPAWLKDAIDKKLYFHNDINNPERDIITDTLNWVLSLEESS